MPKVSETAVSEAAVSLATIRAAAARIAGAVERTPCLQSRTLSALTGCELWLKFENLQFIAALRADKTLPRLPVIFLTSVAEQEGAARAELGAADYLFKPVRLEELLAAVSRQLPSRP